MRLLLVEDEPDVAETLSWGLATEGYVVDTADNGVDGLWKATENAYDVVVLDVMLPGLDGYQVCRRLRERGKWTPILLLTAMDDDLDHAEGLDSGADDYLAKPFSYPVLLAHLRSLTRRTFGARPAVLRAGGLALDPASRTVARDGNPLDLTSREVAVLEHRDLAAGQVQRVAVAGDGPAGRVQGQAARPQDGRPGAERPAGQGAQVRQQDRVGERLGQVVVRAAVQALGVIQVVVHRGEQQDGRPLAPLPQAPAHLVAVEAGQHHVKNDDVVGVLGCLPQCVDAV